MFARRCRTKVLLSVRRFGNVARVADQRNGAEPTDGRNLRLLGGSLRLAKHAVGSQTAYRRGLHSLRRAPRVTEHRGGSQLARRRRLLRFNDILNVAASRDRAQLSGGRSLNVLNGCHDWLRSGLPGCILLRRNGAQLRKLLLGAVLLRLGEGGNRPKAAQGTSGFRVGRLRSRILSVRRHRSQLREGFGLTSLLRFLRGRLRQRLRPGTLFNILRDRPKLRERLRLRSGLGSVVESN